MPLRSLIGFVARTTKAAIRAGEGEGEGAAGFSFWQDGQPYAQVKTK